jgi:EpsD family peptidyl-prolyl cis-trans isomerase
MSLQTHTFLAILLGLSACSSGTDRPRESGQVVARVGDVELTTSQLLQTLTANGAKAEDPASRRLALEALVDRTLLVSRARTEGLDREPAVLGQTQAAIERIHAQAAVERIAAAVPRPGADEIRSFREAHPALFSRRRVYTIEQLTTESATVDATALRTRVSTARRIDEVADWLSARGVAFARQGGTLIPEEAGPTLAATLQQRAEGELLVLGEPPSLQVLHLRRIESRPAEGPKVDAWIERHLLEQRRRKAIDAAVAGMRRDATITLLGEFAPTAGTPVEARAPAASGPAGGNAVVRARPDGSGSVDRGVGALR